MQLTNIIRPFAKEDDQGWKDSFSRAIEAVLQALAISRFLLFDALMGFGDSQGIGL